MRRLIYSPLLPFEIAEVCKQFSAAAHRLWPERRPLARYPPRRLDIGSLLQVARRVIDCRAALRASKPRPLAKVSRKTGGDCVVGGIFTRISPARPRKFRRAA